METLTSNKNRTVADVRHLFDKYGAGLGATNCVSGSSIKGRDHYGRGELDEDTVMMQALEAGAEDFRADEETFEIYTTPDDFFRRARGASKRWGTPLSRPKWKWCRRTISPSKRGEDMAQMRKLLDNGGQRRRAGGLGQLGERGRLRGYARRLSALERIYRRSLAVPVLLQKNDYAVGRGAGIAVQNK